MLYYTLQLWPRYLRYRKAYCVYTNFYTPVCLSAYLNVRLNDWITLLWFTQSELHWHYINWRTQISVKEAAGYYWKRRDLGTAWTHGCLGYSLSGRKRVAIFLGSFPLYIIDKYVQADHWRYRILRARYLLQYHLVHLLSTNGIGILFTIVSLSQRHVVCFPLWFL